MKRIAILVRSGLLRSLCIAGLTIVGCGCDSAGTYATYVGGTFTASETFDTILLAEDDYGSYRTLPENMVPLLVTGSTSRSMPEGISVTQIVVSATPTRVKWMVEDAFSSPEMGERTFHTYEGDGFRLAVKLDAFANQATRPGDYQVAVILPGLDLIQRQTRTSAYCPTHWAAEQAQKVAALDLVKGQKFLRGEVPVLRVRVIGSLSEYRWHRAKQAAGVAAGIVLVLLILVTGSWARNH